MFHIVPKKLLTRMPSFTNVDSLSAIYTLILVTTAMVVMLSFNFLHSFIHIVFRIDHI